MPLLIDNSPAQKLLEPPLPQDLVSRLHLALAQGDVDEVLVVLANDSKDVRVPEFWNIRAVYWFEQLTESVTVLPDDALQPWRALNWIHLLRALTGTSGFSSYRNWVHLSFLKTGQVLCWTNDGNARLPLQDSSYRMNWQTGWIRWEEPAQPL